MVLKTKTLVQNEERSLTHLLPLLLLWCVGIIHALLHDGDVGVYNIVHAVFGEAEDGVRVPEQVRE